MNRYQLIEQYHDGTQRVVNTYAVREEARYEADILNTTPTAAHSSFHVHAYPAEAAETTFERFIHLVADVRYLQRRFWQIRDQQTLTKAIELERRLDQYIQKCDDALSQQPKRQNNPEQKAYFDIVCQMRDTQRQYHQSRRDKLSDTAVQREIMKKARQLENLIDTQNDKYLSQ